MRDKGDDRGDDCVRRRPWSPSALVVLVRGRAEESVLDACKYTVGSIGGPTGGQGVCKQGQTPCLVEAPS